MGAQLYRVPNAESITNRVAALILVKGTVKGPQPGGSADTA
jgi:hypothetical protein